MKLADICKINMGQSPDSSTYNKTQDGLPFFQGNADFGELHPIPRVWCNSPVKVANVGDILISVRAPIGALNIADCECCIGRGLAALSANQSVCKTAYLWYAIASKVNELMEQGTGTTFKAISKTVLEQTELPVPPIPEQIRIAAILDTVNAVTTFHKQQLAKLDELVKARFVEMFGDIISNSQLWPVFTLDKISSSRLGKMLDAKQQTGKNRFPYLANYNVQWFHFELDNLRQMDFSTADQAEFSLQDGDLLICEGGEIGRCAIWHNQISPCFFQKAIHRVRCNAEVVTPEYLSYWFNFHATFNAFEDVVGSMSTIAHLTGEKLKKLEIPVPSIQLQRDFSAFVEQVEKSRLTIRQGLDKMETLKRALMQDYFG